MKKRALSLFLAFVMALGLGIPAFAAEDVFETEAPAAPAEESAPVMETLADEPVPVALPVVDQPAPAAADEYIVSGDCGKGVTWTLKISGDLTIEGSGNMRWNTSNAPWYNYRSRIYNVHIGSGVTSIGGDAFENCYMLESVEIPDSVTEIGYNAFQNCTRLISVDIPKSVVSLRFGCFRNCEQLTSVTGGEGVTSIENNAFSNCGQLTSVPAFKNVTSIGNNAFSYSGLTSIQLSDAIYSIEDSTFSNCVDLKTVQLPKYLKYIGVSAFRGCGSLTEIDLPKNLKWISSGAFGNCGLTQVEIPESVVQIDDGAFSGCYALRVIKILNKECVVELPSPGADGTALGVPGFTVVHGYPDSNTEKYAKEYGYTFVSLTGGGSTDPTDPPAPTDTAKPTPTPIPVEYVPEGLEEGELEKNGVLLDAPESADTDTLDVYIKRGYDLDLQKSAGVDSYYYASYSLDGPLYAGEELYVHYQLRVTTGAKRIKLIVIKCEKMCTLDFAPEEAYVWWKAVDREGNDVDVEVKPGSEIYWYDNYLKLFAKPKDEKYTFKQNGYYADLQGDLQYRLRINTYNTSDTVTLELVEVASIKLEINGNNGLFEIWRYSAGGEKIDLRNGDICYSGNRIYFKSLRENLGINISGAQHDWGAYDDYTYITVRSQEPNLLIIDVYPLREVTFSVEVGVTMSYLRDVKSGSIKDGSKLYLGSGDAIYADAPRGKDITVTGVRIVDHYKNGNNTRYELQLLDDATYVAVGLSGGSSFGGGGGGYGGGGSTGGGTPAPGPSTAPDPTPAPTPTTPTITPRPEEDGWKWDKDGWHYLDENGEPATSTWVDDGGKKYYIDGDGTMVSDDWKAVDGEWYFFKESGEMVANDWLLDGGVWYLLGEDGKMLSGLQQVNMGRGDDGWYYFSEEHDGTFGHVKTGWQLLDDTWYYFNPKHDGAFGRMTVNDWLLDGGVWYFLDPDGKMLAGLSQIALGRGDDGLYYFSEEHDGTYGHVKTGWQTVNGDRYYFNPLHDGSYGRAYVGGTFTIGGQRHTFDSEGRLVG